MELLCRYVKDLLGIFFPCFYFMGFGVTTVPVLFAVVSAS
jgi:hypothetical protein